MTTNLPASKCQFCYRKTHNPNGRCVYHQEYSSPVQANRKVPGVTIGKPTSGRLSEISNLNIRDYFSDQKIEELDSTEQFKLWMSARVGLRRFESALVKQGFEKALEYADRFDDTALALIWERLDSGISESVMNDDSLLPVVEMVQSEVHKRISSDAFNPMDISGFIDQFSPEEPRSISMFF